MRISKTAVCLVFSCSLVIPAIAVAASNNSSNVSQQEAQALSDKAVTGMPTNPDGTYDVSTIRITRQEYMDQIGKSFDKLDLNGDGVIDGQEMLDGQRAAKGHIDSLEDAPPYSMKGSNAAAAARAGGVPPINASQLGK